MQKFSNAVLKPFTYLFPLLPYIVEKDAHLCRTFALLREQI